ncbi:MAG: hypothetical protein HQL27_09815, partial [Candidatus Omnitrophica bacterium]|nr:hypothetical protein [Candidatus Omnitrophota bacterium]
MRKIFVKFKVTPQAERQVLKGFFESLPAYNVAARITRNSEETGFTALKSRGLTLFAVLLSVVLCFLTGLSYAEDSFGEKLKFNNPSEYDEAIKSALNSIETAREEIHEKILPALEGSLDSEKETQRTYILPPEEKLIDLFEANNMELSDALNLLSKQAGVVIKKEGEIKGKITI